MSSTVGFVLWSGLVAIGYAITIVASAHTFWQYGYEQAQSDLRSEQQCHDLTR